MAYLLELRESDSPYSVVVEEDEKVAYAYLRHGRRIVSDVWLYNVRGAPREPEWTDRANAPFANAAAYTKAHDPPLIEREGDIACRWIRDAGRVVAAEVVSRRRLLGRLEPGLRPGFAAIASRDGRLARVLVDEGS